MVSLSFVIVTDNHADSIIEAINALKDIPTKLRREIIIIDNGSIDATLQKLKEVTKGLFKVTIISEPKTTISACVNKAITLSSNEYICFVHGNEILNSIALEDTVNCLKERNIEVALGLRISNIGSNETNIYNKCSSSIKIAYKSLLYIENNNIHEKFKLIPNPLKEILTNKIFDNIGLTSGGAIIRRSLLDKIKGADENCYFPDYSIGLKCAINTKFLIFNHIITHHINEKNYYDNRFIIYDNLLATFNFINDNPHYAVGYFKEFYKFLHKATFNLEKIKLYSLLKKFVRQYISKKQSFSELSEAYKKVLIRLRNY